MPDDKSKISSRNKPTQRKPAIPEIPQCPANIIGLGIDLVARDRVERMLKKHGEKFLRRCFTLEEAEYCMSRPDPIPDLAVRLAAKEAGFKAIGSRRGMGIGWRDFETILDSESVPALRLLGRAKDRGESIGIEKTWMSLTHEEHWSAAVIIITGKS
jgi:holo-[acyl-carrier protein] synthase